MIQETAALEALERISEAIDWRHCEDEAVGRDFGILRATIEAFYIPEPGLDARHMIYALARETLRLRDGYESKGWLMNGLPHEDEVREALEAELREYARLAADGRTDRERA